MDKKTQDIAYFISFCIEQYKNEHAMTGTQAMRCFDEYGVLEYLSMNYETMHTQSRQWILEDLNDLIKSRRKEESGT